MADRRLRTLTRSPGLASFANSVRLSVTFEAASKWNMKVKIFDETNCKQQYNTYGKQQIKQFNRAKTFQPLITYTGNRQLYTHLAY